MASIINRDVSTAGVRGKSSPFSGWIVVTGATLQHKVGYGGETGELEEKPLESDILDGDLGSGKRFDTDTVSGPRLHTAFLSMYECDTE